MSDDRSAEAWGKIVECRSRWSSKPIPGLVVGRSGRWAGGGRLRGQRVSARPDGTSPWLADEPSRRQPPGTVWRSAPAAEPSTTLTRRCCRVEPALHPDHQERQREHYRHDGGDQLQVLIHPHRHSVTDQPGHVLWSTAGERVRRRQGLPCWPSPPPVLLCSSAPRVRPAGPPSPAASPRGRRRSGGCRCADCPNPG